jgi:multidrug efflux pump subunit AcrA (membrane-fusion protein)
MSLAGCAEAPAEEAGESEPAYVEAIEGTELNRVTLTEHAAQRLGIETAEVTEEMVARDLTVSGRVEESQASADSASIVRVRVPLNTGDMAKVAPGQPARILSFDDEDDDDDDGEEDGLEAEAIDLDDINDVEDDPDDEPALYYQVNAGNHNLVPGQGVRVKLSLVESGSMRKVIPYSALIYDLDGSTWIYVSPEPLVFMRQPVTVDFIEGDRVILSDGPSVGTAVATVGVAELYGADTGVGK